MAGYALLPLFGLTIWGTGLLRPAESAFVQDNQVPTLFDSVYNGIPEITYLPEILGFMLVILSSVLIQRIGVEFGFIRIRSLLPGIIFMLIAGGFSGYHTFHPVFPAILFLLLAIYRLFRAFDQRKAYSQIFDAAFLLGLGSLFYINVIVLLPAFIAGGKILGRETRWRELAVIIIGFIIPWLFVFSGFFLTDNLPGLISILKLNFTTGNHQITQNIPQLIFLGLLGLLTLAGSYLIMVQYDEKKVSIRQFFLVFFLMFLSVAAAVVFLPSASAEALLIAAVPVTFLLNNMLLSFRKLIWGELVLYLLAGFSIGLQFI
jgi:hypothetical protein